MMIATLRGLLGRKLRTVLTALAIVLGVAMVGGSYILTDSISKAFDSIFASSYTKTDAVISGKALTDESTGGATVPASLLTRVRNTPGVGAAAGEIFNLNSSSDEAKLLDRHGKVVTGNGSPTFGFGIDPAQPRFSPLQLTSGRWAAAPGEVVIDASSAAKYRYRVGDTIGVEVGGPLRRFAVVGVAKYGNVSSIGSATFAIFDVNVARQLLHKHGFDTIAVAASSGVSGAELVKRLAAVVPANAQVRSGQEQAKEDKKGVASFVAFIRYALLAFGLVALFVGAFVIFNTLSITVAQRMREFATLRTLGASRRQILRAVIVEAVVVGLVASLLGLATGFGLAEGLTALFAALGLDLPRTGLVFAPRTAVVAIGLGTAVTLIAGLLPALRATKVPPIAAVREGAALPKGRLARHSLPIGLVLVAASCASIGFGLFVHGPSIATHLATVLGGVLTLFVGVSITASRLVPTLARVVGKTVSSTGGVAGRLARQNAVRNPGRTAATASALMIGLALVACLSVFTKGLLDSHSVAVQHQLNVDYVTVSQNGFSAMPVSVGKAIAQAPGVQVASSVRSERSKFDGANIDVSGVDPSTIASVYRFDWTQGSDASIGSLSGGEAVVRGPWAKKQGLAVGDAFTLRTPGGKPVRLRVAALYKPAKLDELLGDVLIAQKTFDRTFEQPGDAFTFVHASNPAGLRATLAAYPDTQLLTAQQFANSRAKNLKSIIELVYVLLALSVIVSLFGMVNTLVLSVFEQTREIGMLRAVGLTRRQTRRMIRRESIITALIGATLGISLGVGLALALTRALSNQGVTFSVPVLSIAVFTLVAVTAGTLAAILPARRASRLNVLAALQYE